MTGEVMTTTSDPTTAAPTIELPESEVPTPPATKPRRGRLVTALAAAVLAAGAATVWISTSGGGDADPVPVETVVEEGQQYGSADAAERQTAPDGQSYGSADAAEEQTSPDEQPLPDGADPRVLP
jgi:hypothetical protein